MDNYSLNFINIDTNIYKIIVNKDLNFKNIPLFIKHIEDRIDYCEEILIDLLNLDSMDISVIGGILSLHSKYNCKIKILNINSNVRKIINLVKFHDAHFIEII